MNFIKMHPYVFGTFITSIIISLGVWITSGSFGYFLLMFGIMSFIIVGVSAYNNLD